MSATLLQPEPTRSDAPSAPAAGRGWIIPGLLLALDLLTRLGAALRPLPGLDGLTIPDDAYLSLTIARNLAQGLGPLYGAEPTSGFQPLYVFLIAPAYWVWPMNPFVPVRAALIILALFDVLALALFYRLIARHCRSPFAPALAAAAWIASPAVLKTTLNGLETMVAFSLIVATLLAFYSFFWPVVRPRPIRHGLLTGLLLGLAILARIDSVLLAPALGLGFLLAWRDRARTRREARNLATGAGALALGAATIVIPWLAWIHAWTGDCYPISGRAVRLLALLNVWREPTWSNWYWPSIRRGLQTLVAAHGGLMALWPPLALVCLVAGRRAATRELAGRLSLAAPVWLFAILLFGAYTIHLPAFWFFPRYLFPLTLAVLFGLALLADAALGVTTRPAWRRRLVIIMFLCAIGPQLASRSLHEIYTTRENRELGYMNLGLWARERFPAGTVLGAPQSGAVGYFARNLRVVNLDGVVNKACYQSLEAGRNMDYIRRAGVEYIIAWPVNIDHIRRHSRNFRKDDLQPVEHINGFRSWTLEWDVYRVNRQAKR